MAFGISDGTFAIVAGASGKPGNEGAPEAKESGKKGGKRMGEREYFHQNRQLLKASSDERAASRANEEKSPANITDSGSGKTTTIFSARTGGSYYIYSFDGRLLAEYNPYGACVKDYIYMGDHLIAEYKTLGSQYYYYTPDHIRSTRIVTDDSGTVVYSAAYDPYGGIQKTWVDTFNPTPKFSGKERDGESDLGYFGARYYDRAQYRFISVDPLISVSSTTTNPVLWNTYAYCRDNPVGYIEISGLFSLFCTVNLQRVEYNQETPKGVRVWKGPGLTYVDKLNISPQEGASGKPELAFEIQFAMFIWNDRALEFWGKDFGSTWAHEVGCHVWFVGQWVSLSLGRIEETWRKEMVQDPDKALKHAQESFDKVVHRAAQLSVAIFDTWVTDIVGRYYRFWEEVNNDWVPWRDDPFMTWALRICI
jgi:RHS repeat-associated protein